MPGITGAALFGLALEFPLYPCNLPIVSVQELVMQLPRIEKIRLMESLWTDLSGSEEEIDSPQWHERLLLQTQQRVEEGAEKVVDWDEAKKRLRRS